MLTNDRVVELGIIKVVGILLVVFAHVTRMYTPQALILFLMRYNRISCKN